MSSPTTTTTNATVSLITTASALQDFLYSIKLGTSLYMDLEGKDLSRKGTLTLITILLHPQNTVHIIDIQTLGAQAFTLGSPPKTLKSVLEDPAVQKYIWDLRNDADALKSLYGVGLAGVLDIQLLENATRYGSKTYLRGLSKCVEYDLRSHVSPAVMAQWVQCKKVGTAGMEEDNFSVRPLTENTLRYCVGDVQMLPALRELYMQKITPNWLTMVKQESARRVVEAHSAGYQPNGETKRYGPWKNAGTDLF